MTFSLVATPEPAHIPPRVFLEATESDPDKPIQSCLFYRDGVALRFAAQVAGDAAVAYDYDAPFDVAMEYRADAQESDTLVLDWTETWASLAAWTSAGSGGGWSVGSGIATGQSIAGPVTRSIYRASSGTIAKVHGVTPTLTAPGSDGAFEIALRDSAGALATLKFEKAATRIRLTGTSGTDDYVNGVTPTTFDIVVGADSVTASGTGWSLTAPYEGAATELRLSVIGAGLFENVVATIDDVSVYTFPTDLLDVTATDTTELTGVTAAWLTNAAAPDLAVQVARYSEAAVDDFVFSPDTGKDTQAAASSVQLELEGSSIGINVATGPRKAETWAMHIVCKTAAARRVLANLLANSAPISLRLPASLTYMELDDGFYAVGDITRTRHQTPTEDRPEASTVVLPLTQIRPPAFDVLWEWSWDALAQSGLTWDQVAEVYDSWTDLLIGPPS